MSNTINREYKDRLFKKVFESKEDLLSLYNAINGTDYDNPDDIEVNTIEEFIYMNMKNDLAIDKAIDDCIKEGILEDILVKHRLEVTDMLLTEYDEQLHIDNEKGISFEEGKAEGLAEGKEEGRTEEIISLVKDGLLQPDIGASRLGISLEEFEKLLEEKVENK